MVRQLVQPSQVAQDDLDGDVVPDADHVEIHQCADGVLRVGQCRAQLLALLRRERAEDILDHLTRKIRRQIRNLVGIELLGRRHQLLVVHVRDQCLAHRVRHLEQDLAVAIGFDQVPYDQPLLDRERFEDIGDVRRVQRLEQPLQLRQVCLVH